MVKLVVLYKKPNNTESFDQHYRNVHMPLARKMPLLRRVEISKVIGSPAPTCDYHLLAELYFDNMEHLQQSMGSAEGKAAAKDVMSFAKDIVYMMFAEVEESTVIN